MKKALVEFIGTFFLVFTIGMAVRSGSSLAPVAIAAGLIAVIYAGVNGYLDPLPVNRVRAFEDGLLSLVRTKNNDILEDIRKSNDLSSDNEKKLKGVVEAYAKTFA